MEILARQIEPNWVGVAEGLVDIRQLTTGALAEMRALIFQLRPGALHEEGVVAAITKHAAALSASQQLDIRVVGPKAKLIMEKSVEVQLFSILREALHNVVKHAGAQKATVRLSVAGANHRHLVIEVEDNGSGFDSTIDRPGHFGLESMSERIAELGGTFEVNSAPGCTVVRGRIPDVVDQ